MRVLVAGLGRFAGAPSEKGLEGAASYAEAIRSQYAGTASALGGFLGAAEELGLDVLLTSVVAVGRAAAVSREAFETLRTRIFSELRGWKVDAVYLALDGSLLIAERSAPSARKKPAAEPELIRAMRERLGMHVPIAVTLDSDPAPAAAAAVQACAAVSVTPATLPGADPAGRGAAAAGGLLHLLPDEVRVTTEEVWPRASRPTPSLQLVLPSDPACGAAPGEAVPLGLSVGGLDGRTVSVGWFVCDELGRVRWDLREERRVTGDPALLRFAWPLQGGDPPGVYSIRAMAWAPEDRWQGIASGTIEVLDPVDSRRAAAARFPPVPRDRLLAPRTDFPATAREALLELFHAVEPACRAAHNADGSWGSESRDRRAAQHIAIFTRTAENAIAYLQAYSLFGDAVYATEARRGLDFLAETQLPNGGWCPWTFTWITPQWVFLKEACFYDTGSVARALWEGYRALGDQRYLEAVRRAADYALTAPYTGNNNYDAFLLWYLAPYAQHTGDPRYLEHAVARCREAVLPGQQPYGGFPAHNLSTGYQAIITYGLLALCDAVPSGHPYRAPLRRATLMALNFLIWLQDGQGGFYSGWEYDRTFGVTRDGRPQGSSTSPAGGRLIEVFRNAAAQFELHERVYRGLCSSITRLWAATGKAGRAQSSDLLATTALLTWLRGPKTTDHQ